jgi:hypothetical protein
MSRRNSALAWNLWFMRPVSASQRIAVEVCYSAIAACGDDSVEWLLLRKLLTLAPATLGKFELRSRS